MKNIIKTSLFIIICIILSSCSVSKNNDENINNLDKKDKSTMNIIINNTSYKLNIEENETTNALTNLLPLDLKLTELNGNEKYVYLDEKLPTNTYKPKKISKGDVMLYNNDCLVIFYKSFETSYSYTKIGHIDDLPDLGTGSINVKLSR